MPAFEAVGGMPYWIDLSSSDPTKSAYFYSQLLGWEFDTDDSGYRLGRLQGLPVAGIIPHDGSAPETWVTYFLVDNIERSCARVSELGGRVLSGPTRVRLGEMALLADASGALLGLIEPAGEDAFVAAGEPGTTVWHELSVTSGFEQAVEFYHDFLGWELVTVSEGDYGYATALQDGAAFAGIRDARGHFPDGVGSFWQSFIGVEDLREACQKVENFGGEVVRGPEESEFGFIAVIGDPTGATVMLCEVDPAPDELEMSESDDLFHL